MFFYFTQRLYKYYLSLISISMDGQNFSVQIISLRWLDDRNGLTQMCCIDKTLFYLQVWETAFHQWWLYRGTKQLLSHLIDKLLKNCGKFCFHWIAWRDFVQNYAMGYASLRRNAYWNQSPVYLAKPISGLHISYLRRKKSLGQRYTGQKNRPKG